MSPWLHTRARIDRIVALIGSILTAPLVAVCALLVRSDSPGPPIIRVTRVGRSGTPFGMWKLRTMQAASGGGLAGGQPLTASSDPRVTRVGRLLRATHIDEIPQLWNVARGEMLLLGPRPEAPDFVDLDDPRWNRVLSVAPGIAGPTQLIVGEWERTVIGDVDSGARYRSIVLPVKLAIDAWYVNGASPRCDARVLVGLACQLALGRPPSQLQDRVISEVPAASAAIPTSSSRQAQPN